MNKRYLSYVLFLLLLVAVELNMDLVFSYSCSALKPCPYSNWVSIESGKIGRQKCVNGQCVWEYKEVECSSNSDCPPGYTCAGAGTPDAYCKKIEPGSELPIPEEVEIQRLSWEIENLRRQVMFGYIFIFFMGLIIIALIIYILVIKKKMKKHS